MNETGYILVRFDIDPYDENTPIICLAFSLVEEDLIEKLSILNRDYTEQLEEFNSQSSNCDKYINEFEKAWTKYEQKHVIPFYTSGIPQNKMERKERSAKEHAEYKKIKDFNTENGRKNRNFNFCEKSKFIRSWMIDHPPDKSYKKFIEIMEDSARLIKSNWKSISYSICKIGEVIN